MTEQVALHDFIEVEYTGRFTDGTIFDTTDKETALKSKLFSPQMNYRPLIVCVGESQLLEGLDKALGGKEVGKAYTVNLKPEEAFGKKDFKKIKLVPIAEFQKKKMAPQPGLQIDLDGEIGTIIRAEGGRILVNFNHPFAGREVVYEFKINRKVTDKKEQLDSFLELSLNVSEIKTEVKEEKATITLPMELPKVLQEEFSKKLKEVVGLKEINFLREKEKTDEPVNLSENQKKKKAVKKEDGLNPPPGSVQV